MSTIASTSQLARSPSPEQTFESTPVAFEAETELLALVARWRAELERRVEATWRAQGSGDRAVLERMRVIVHKEFYDVVAKAVASNTSVAGLPYKQFKAKQADNSSYSGPTQAFNEVLHQRVTRYQDKLFDDREVNIVHRADAPRQVERDLTSHLERESRRLDLLEQRARTPWPAPVASEAVPSGKKARKSLSSAASKEPDAAMAFESFSAGHADVKRLMTEVPTLVVAADEAHKVAQEATALALGRLA